VPEALVAGDPGDAAGDVIVPYGAGVPTTHHILHPVASTVLQHHLDPAHSSHHVAVLVVLVVKVVGAPDFAQPSVSVVRKVFLGHPSLVASRQLVLDSAGRIVTNLDSSHLLAFEAVDHFRHPSVAVVFDRLVVADVAALQDGLVEGRTRDAEAGNALDLAADDVEALGISLEFLAAA